MTISIWELGATVVGEVRRGVRKIGRVNLYRQLLLEKRKKFNSYSVEVGRNRATVSQAAVPEQIFSPLKSFSAWVRLTESK